MNTWIVDTAAIGFCILFALFLMWNEERAARAALRRTPCSGGEADAQ